MSVVHVYTQNAFPATYFRLVSHKPPMKGGESCILQLKISRVTPASETREAVLLRNQAC